MCERQNKLQIILPIAVTNALNTVVNLGFRWKYLKHMIHLKHMTLTSEDVFICQQKGNSYHWYFFFFLHLPEKN